MEFTYAFVVTGTVSVMCVNFHVSTPVKGVQSSE